MDINILAFLAFGAVEAAGIFIMMFYLFRFNAKTYAREIAIASLMFPFLSYLIRIELELNPITYPFVSIFYFAFFAYSILKAPPIWSLIISSLTNVIYFVIQTILLVLLIAVDGISFQAVTHYQSEAHILQLLSFLLVVAASYQMYIRGYGFSFPFHIFRWKGENRWMAGIILIWFVLLSILFVRKNLIYGLVVASVILLLLLYFAIRKERSES